MILLDFKEKASRQQGGEKILRFGNAEFRSWASKPDVTGVIYSLEVSRDLHLGRLESYVDSDRLESYVDSVARA